VCPGNATAHGEAFAEELFRGDDPPDAIAAMSDELALGALRAAAGTGVLTNPATVVTELSLIDESSIDSQVETGAMIMAVRAYRMPRGAQSHRAHRLDRGEHQSQATAPITWQAPA
jgi:DNA-binding LacI/PurR family transcriptional regulator